MPHADHRVVQQSDDITIISTGGIVLRLKVNEIREAGRSTRGVKMMKLQAGETVAAVARIANADLKKIGEGYLCPEAPAGEIRERHIARIGTTRTASSERGCGGLEGQCPRVVGYAD